MNQDQVDKLKLPSGTKIIEVLKKMDRVKAKLLILVDEHNKYLNLISVGDVQRAIIAGYSLEASIDAIDIDKKVVANKSDEPSSIKLLMKRLRSEFMPVLDNDGNLIDVIFWEDLFDTEYSIESKKNNIPVVIMAGGKGSRLKPLSNIIPKPLVPIGENTIIEEIISRFANSGTQEAFISVNYKKEFIKQYLASKSLPLNVSYFSENKPLGTAGSLSLIKDKIKSTFYLSNCDILVEQDYNQLYQYHKENKNEITLVAALKEISIPYGTIISGKDGLLQEIKEKPSLSFKINAGVYLLEPHLLHEIPVNEFFHITDLIEQVRKRKGRIGVFPVSEKSWLDIGEWPEYIKTVKRLSNDNNFVGLI